jgi:hypothetical protein
VRTTTPNEHCSTVPPSIIHVLGARSTVVVILYSTVLLDCYYWIKNRMYWRTSTLRQCKRANSAKNRTVLAYAYTTGRLHTKCSMYRVLTWEGNAETRQLVNNMDFELLMDEARQKNLPYTLSLKKYYSTGVAMV